MNQKKLDKAIFDAGHYGPSGRHSIVKVPNSKWLIVDSWYRGNELVGLGIHWDGEQVPNAHLLVASDFFPLDDAEALAKDWNFQFTRQARIALRMAIDMCPYTEIIENKAERAWAHYLLAKKIRKNPYINNRASYGIWTVGRTAKLVSKTETML